jgi:hypothetical protein
MFKKNTYTGFDINWDKIPDDNTTKRNLKFVYDNISPMSKKMTYVINGVPIIFDKKDTDIAMTLSGGADSTMLLYLLCTIIRSQALKTRIHCMTLLRFTEDRMYLEDVVTGVIKYIKDKFPDIEIIQHWGFIPTAFEMTPLAALEYGLKKTNMHYEFENVIERGATADVYAVHSYAMYIRKRYNICWQYDGTTTNPEFTADQEHTPIFRNPRILNQGDLRGPYTLSEWYNQADRMNTSLVNSPFEFIQKNWVMAQYKNFGLEDLLELTRSCEGSTMTLNKKFGEGNWTTRGSDYICNECFFCGERQWGIDTSNIFLRENCE